jgi:hypothetical protein
MEYRGVPLIEDEIADCAYPNFIDPVVVNPFRVRPDIINELEQNLVLRYMGTTSASDRIIATGRAAPAPA